MWRGTKAAYQDVLTLWKNADTDIPILKQAKAEHSRLLWRSPNQAYGKHEQIHC